MPKASIVGKQNWPVRSIVRMQIGHQRGDTVELRQREGIRVAPALLKTLV